MPWRTAESRHAASFLPQRLRARYRNLLRQAPPTVARWLQLVPVLLHVDLGRRLPPAPGVRKLRHRPALWARWCRSMGLPPPASRSLGWPRVEAVLALPRYTPSRAPYQLLVVVDPEAPANAAVTTARLDWIRTAFGWEDQVQATVTRWSDIEKDPLLCSHLVLEGAWAAGELSGQAVLAAGSLMTQAMALAAVVGSPELAAALVLAAGEGDVFPPACAIQSDPAAGGLAWLAAQGALGGDVLSKGQALSATIAWRARHAGRVLRGRVGAEHRQRGFPVFLRSALARYVASVGPPSPAHRVPGGRWTVTLGERPLASGATRAQVEVRSRWLLQGLDSGWATALERERIVVELGLPEGGSAPASRTLRRDEHLRLTFVRRGRRPSAVEPPPAAAWDRLLSLARARRPIELGLAAGDIRQGQLRELLRFWTAPGLPPAIELDGEAWVPTPKRVLHFAPGRLLARPRALRLEASSGLGPADKPWAGLAPAIETWAQASDAGLTALLYRDHAGCWLREEVAIAHVDEHLADTQEILRASGALLLIHPSSPEHLANPEGEVVLQFAVEGALPHRLHLTDLDGRPLADAGHWEEAALVLLAQVPVGAPVRLRCRRVSLPPTARPLEQLYVRSVAQRRLLIHLRFLIGLNRRQAGVEESEGTT